MADLLPTEPISKRDQTVLAFLREHAAVHGHAPTVVQISEGVGASTRTVVKAIRSLALRGLVRHHPRRPRGLEITTSSGAPLTAPHPLVEQLVKTRVHRGVPLREIAARLGVCTSTVNNYELGLRQPTPQRLEQWAAALGLRLTLTPTNPMEKP
ncbi:helix-turn-helix domain-containing protein [Actinomadura sp. WMMA1423]|uniref:LexA family protein n=1 Tax=Actinomadura sp. WMMA1423 TaxID=2591108 RepID=UPI0011461F11|nr:helix-turn-helix domain-containing protein [Actinomadura sp. WMMA1423]